MINPFISVVSPVYYAENIVEELVLQLRSVLSKITLNYEIILVEDGSTDNSWKKIEEIHNKYNKNVRGIKLSRNFGQHYAITAGIEAAKGDYVIVIDCDLQENPIYILDLYNKIYFSYKPNCGPITKNPSVSFLIRLSIMITLKL